MQVGRRALSDVGRRSIDAELMIRMLIVGYGFGIRSERRLCEEVHLNLPIAGSVAWGSTATSPIIRSFPSTATGVFARAIFCATVRDRDLALHDGRDRWKRGLRGRRQLTCARCLGFSSPSTVGTLALALKEERAMWFPSSRCCRSRDGSPNCQLLGWRV
jgi:Transposase domain (DUF772)